MPAIAQVGDLAGGAITGNLAPTVLINGIPVAVKGATIASHGSVPHNSAIMLGASSTVFANGIPVCRVGDIATCGHTVTVGSANVTAG